ncbi:MAG TPA: tRNA (adenosine(37)-N6)-threonylcarbamoyltransferase complex transferase subunit TsaD [Nitrospirae bacterium]|nr:tRNA (adenosine(37)-N6)-threonylcarbamoyltransferase complex transferase subunit TsaD [Nitrospirota bacterium]
MLILGIDTSCDDTSAAIVKDGKIILSNIVSSQSEIHTKYGGIVPELASRRHSENIIPVVDLALSKAGIDSHEIDAIAVCHGPGLIGSLLVGCCFVKSFAYILGKPILTVNHLEGHIYSNLIVDNPPQFPFISLIVSGGHTSLYLVKNHGEYKELGKSRDDAAGEAYDKVSKLMGLGYPGGPIIDKLAQKGNPNAFEFPRPYLSGSLDFSFSGLKTSVKNTIKKISPKGDSLSLIQKTDLSASFQASVVDVLIQKVHWALKSEGIQRVSINGGVSANAELRKRIVDYARENKFEVYLPPLYLCTDNGAMISAVGYQKYIRGERANLDFNVKAYLPL